MSTRVAAGREDERQSVGVTAREVRRRQKQLGETKREELQRRQGHSGSPERQAGGSGGGK